MKTSLFILLFVLLTNVSFSQSVKSSDKLVSFYSLNGNADDMSGNGRHCTIVGATLATGVDGQENSCFDVTDGYLEYSDSLPMPDSVLTFSAWINPSEFNYMSIFRCQDGALDFNIWYNYDDYFNQDSYYIYPVCTLVTKKPLEIGWTTWGTYESTPNMEINTWFHYFVEFNKDTVSIFINNQLVYESIKESNFIEESITYDGLKIGEDFKGKIDEVYIVNDVLTQQERTELFNFGAASVVSTNAQNKSTTSVKYFDNSIQFNFSNKIETSYIISNSFGQAVANGYLNASSYTLNINNLSKGTYYLVTDGNYISSTKFIVK